MESKTKLDIIATKDGKHYHQSMTYDEWMKFCKTKKKNGFIYIAYELGYETHVLQNEKKPSI